MSPPVWQRASDPRSAIPARWGAEPAVARSADPGRTWSGASTTASTQLLSSMPPACMGVNADVHWERLGLKLGDGKSAPFWGEFLANLKSRGLGSTRHQHLRCPGGSDPGRRPDVPGLQLAALLITDCSQPPADSAEGPARRWQRISGIRVLPSDRPEPHSAPSQRSGPHLKGRAESLEPGGRHWILCRQQRAQA